MADTLFGKTYNTIGSKDSHLILKTKGDVKIQYGNKYISLIKNGKINQDQSILKRIDSNQDIVIDGIYIDSSKNINFYSQGELNTLSTKQVLYESQELTEEQREQALKNLGIAFNTLQEAQNTKPNYGFFYVLDSKKVYLVNGDEYIDILEKLK